jgi:hypothetical protein
MPPQVALFQSFWPEALSRSISDRITQLGTPCQVLSTVSIEIYLNEVALLYWTSGTLRGSYDNLFRFNALGFYRLAGPQASGSVTVNLDPLFNWLSTETVPCICSITCFTIERPKPVPPTSRERALSTR